MEEFRPIGSSVARENDNLNILAIFHYVVGGLMALASCFPVFHLLLGIMFIVAPESHRPGEPSPAIFGWFFICIAASLIAVGWAFSAAVVYAGRCLAKRQKRTFCMVMAGLACAVFPFGTVLGVFTIVELSKENVKEDFFRNALS